MDDTISTRALDLELSCPVCQCLFSEPVTLPCGHTFCEACLKESATLIRGGSGGHCCPGCKEAFQGLGSLPRNAVLCRIIEGYKRTVGGEGVSMSLARTQQQQDAGQGADFQKGDCCVGGLDLASAQTNEAEEYVAEVLSSVQLEDSEDLAELHSLSASSFTEPDLALKSKVQEGRIKLNGLAKDLEVKLACAERLLLKETDKQAEVRAAHSDLWEKVSTLLQKMADLVEAYSVTGIELIEAQLKPIAEALDGRVRRMSGIHTQLKEAQLQADAILNEQDGVVFCQGLSMIEPLISGLMNIPLEDDEGAETQAKARGKKQQQQEEEEDVSRPDLAAVCAALERQNAHLRAELSSAQRDLRSLLNPSEVTFDPDTLHPSLVLSDDLKSVSFSPTKQAYPPQAKRFGHFLQVLSSQVFGESFGVAGGEHCWELELEGCPWVVGVCYGGLPRTGMSSALESSLGSWCLMYCDNLLRVYEQKRPTELKRTTSLRRVQIHLSFKRQSVAYYLVSNIDGKKMHLHTSQVIAFTEPLHLAVRMMSGQPKARITLLNC